MYHNEEIINSFATIQKEIYQKVHEVEYKSGSYLPDQSPPLLAILQNEDHYYRRFLHYNQMVLMSCTLQSTNQIMVDSQVFQVHLYIVLSIELLRLHRYKALLSLRHRVQ